MSVSKFQRQLTTELISKMVSVYDPFCLFTIEMVVEFQQT
jgi:hypothetical protein